MDKLLIKSTKHRGRGVFAGKNFKSGEVIEICPVIVLSPQDSAHYEKTVLGEYLYEWKSTSDGAVILGNGLLYNHSYAPNAEYVRDFDNKTMIYKAIKPIKRGKEIVINYNGHPDCDDPIDWFDVK